jgi:hypothetical protein
VRERCDSARETRRKTIHYMLPCTVIEHVWQTMCIQIFYVWHSKLFLLVFVCIGKSTVDKGLL